jgi:nucleoside-diphosphate-sugar epimerase
MSTAVIGATGRVGSEVVRGLLARGLLVAREWSMLAGENDYTTDTFQQLTGHPPRPVAEFLKENRASFA